MKIPGNDSKVLKNTYNAVKEDYNDKASDKPSRKGTNFLHLEISKSRSNSNSRSSITTPRSGKHLVHAD
jgi:hypothetical protein